MSRLSDWSSTINIVHTRDVRRWSFGPRAQRFLVIAFNKLSNMLLKIPRMTSYSTSLANLHRYYLTPQQVTGGVLITRKINLSSKFRMQIVAFIGKRIFHSVFICRWNLAYTAIIETSTLHNMIFEMVAMVISTVAA